MTDRLGFRVSARHLGEGMAYAWRASAWRLVARVWLTAAAGATPIAAAWLTKLVLDRIVGGGGRPFGLVLALAAVGVLAVMLPHVNGYVDRELNRLVTVDAKRRLFSAVGRLQGLARFENPRFHDRLQVAGNGASGPVDLLNGGLSIGQGMLTAAGFLVSLFALNPWLVLAVAVAAVPTLRAELRLARQRADILWRLSGSARRELFYADLLTSVTALKEVRMYGLGDLFGGRMLAELLTMNREQRRVDRRELAAQALLAIGGAAIAGGGLTWAVLAAYDGRLSVGDVSVVVAAVAGVQGAIGTTIRAIGHAHRALLLYDHYRFIVRAEPDLSAPTGQARPVQPLRHGIELRDVWFRYSPDLPWVLRGVDLVLPAGRATALVGLNGSGKSTLVKLLCRFYDPTRGAVLWDGTDIRELDLDQLRRRIGVVFQDFMSYELSAAENVGVGDVDALDDRRRIEAAADRAGCDGFLNALPHGFDTMLTRVFRNSADRDDISTGVVLSGGQWQRVALARALVRDGCDLLILDEPSAGLDAQAEHQIHQRLAAHRTGRTSLLISHRLSTVRDADAIVVLSDGAVVERGVHDELTAAGGHYADLFTMQAAGYRDEAVVSR